MENSSQTLTSVLMGLLVILILGLHLASEQSFGRRGKNPSELPQIDRLHIEKISRYNY